MQKISTIFERDGQTRGVTDQFSPWVEGFNFEEAIATEKLDGTNVRITVRNHTLVRLEKRRNPTKLEKAKGLVEPWYVDASEFEAGDKYMWEAAQNTDLSSIEDGEWSAEALGPKIQGNPLNLEKHILFLFSVPSEVAKVVFDDAPHTFEELKVWLPQQRSKFGKDCGIEGLVWHHPSGKMAKIKQKDFK